MDAIRRFLASPVGKILTGIVVLAILGSAVYAVYSFIKGDTPGDPNLITFVDSESGKPFKH